VAKSSASLHLSCVPDERRPVPVQAPFRREIASPVAGSVIRRGHCFDRYPHIEPVLVPPG